MKIKLAATFFIKDDWFLATSARNEIKQQIDDTICDEDIDEICAALVNLGYMQGVVEVKAPVSYVTQTTNNTR